TASSLNSAVYICFGIFFIAGLSKGSLILRYLWKTKFRGKLTPSDALLLRSGIDELQFVALTNHVPFKLPTDSLRH
ncbi:hypothetical protein, partial [Collimonas sp.]|uniref:hypothetical protein n=1 Tax=Collimonas sp. TaxID=1963772 RepID=UPI0037BF6300